MMIGIGVRQMRVMVAAVLLAASFILLRASRNERGASNAAAAGLFRQSQKELMELKQWRSRQEQKKRAKAEMNSSSATQVGNLRLRAWNNQLGREKDYYATTALPPPLGMLSFANFTSPPVPMSSDEQQGGKCSFLGAQCPMEVVEHRLVEHYLTPEDVVLEVGARFGTTSCAIAAKQRNSGRLVAVEPDSAVWHLLAHNQADHACAFWILRGVVSNAGHAVAQRSYGTRTMQAGTGPQGDFLTLRALQTATGLQFTALLIDCEGCIDNLFLTDSSSNSSTELSLAQSLQGVHTVILEGDMGHLAPDCHANCVRYDNWAKKLHALGFSKVHQETDPRFWFIAHYVFQRR